MKYRYIRFTKDNHIANLTLNRPEKRNAFTPTMVNEIAHIFDVINNDDSIKVVLIKAEGPIFCAGMDLKTFENSELDEINPNILNKNISLGQVFDSLLKPSIAVVEGNVIAGGFLIILGCTYVFCQEETQFRLPELNIGIFPFQVIASLLKVMPEKKVLQLCLNTEYFDAKKAIELGIVDGLYAQESINNLTNSFREINIKALKAGLQALRNIAYVPQKEQFSYLKDVLDSLKKG